LPALEDAFVVDPFVNRALNVIGDTLAERPLKFFRKTTVGGEIEIEPVTDHPVVELFRYPEPRTSGFSLIRDAAIHAILSGEFFFFLENGSTGKSMVGEIQRIQAIKPRFIKNVSVGSNGMVDGYTFSQNGQSQTFDPEFFVQGMSFNPRSDTRGLSAIEVLQSPILLSFYMEKHNRQFFKDGANPGFFLQTPGVLSEPAREAKEGEFIGLGNVSRDKILTALGVPPVIAGIFEFANYANSTQQMLIFYQHTIKPIGRMIEEAINTQLIKVWYGNDPGLFCRFDYSEVDVLQGDRLIASQIRKSDVEAGIITPNEAREQLKMEPSDDEGADELRTPGSGGFGGLLSGGPPSDRKAAIPPTRLDQWKARDADFRRGERAMEKAAAQFFEDQADRVIMALDAIGLLAEGIPDNIRALDPDDLFEIFDPDAEDAAILDALMPTIAGVMVASGESSIASVTAGVQFNVADPRVQAFLSDKTLKIKDINRVTEKAMRQLLVDATAETLTVSQTSRRIRDMFTNFSKVRADTIARTEVVSASNAAAVEGFRQSGVVKGKQWLTVQDGSARDSHAAIDGQEVALGELFGNGLPAPGVAGPPEEVINCRCTVLPVLEDA
jgi:SPP1 gp7 family putative phage head morphogenesis protein